MDDVSNWKGIIGVLTTVSDLQTTTKNFSFVVPRTIRDIHPEGNEVPTSEVILEKLN